MLPNFLVIGAQKSGSTFLLKCLGEHPDVFMPPNETRFFEDPEYLKTDLHQSFKMLFNSVSREKAVGIKRPAYLAKPECPERIFKHVPNAKLVVILRNPVERAVSAYFHYMRCGFIPIKPLEEGMKMVITGAYKDLYPKSAEIIEYGFYHRHLTRYLDYFGRNQMLILILDAVKLNPLESIRQVYRFLGVNDGYMPRSLSLKSQRNPGVYSLPRLRLLKFRNPFMYAYSEDRTRRFPKDPNWLGRLANKMVTWTDERLLTSVCRNLRPELSTPLKKGLFEIYEADVSQLETFLGQDLAGWKLLPKPLLA